MRASVIPTAFKKIAKNKETTGTTGATERATAMIDIVV
jgi:hypothetical protein